MSKGKGKEFDLPAKMAAIGKGGVVWPAEGGVGPPAAKPRLPSFGEARLNQRGKREVRGIISSGKDCPKGKLERIPVA